ncbi:MAG: hypothetical protein A2736_02945 [Candidatus Yanofskybacteria bacterium RIFCSPHIGHO2_01_FULL_41_27]|uniref:Uncharacterized protein n=3 Tax=Parcubacteria group TaxID=1794811 RepID=A0A1F8HSQ1_9BACT|nr:MAG: hypothetical protein UU83_C0031G0006 [Candidatus Jorgensenbacteria bacterium GW2011_GWF2_41_8]OGM99214.1 MAG: hypothetical protein A2736_02945 [Candidatus Yanofskybacteria bacterium RIFCSPHIGHO2_01_FULL_41_27]OGN09094.1 MAG: hypothetical protein A3C64_01775 [Candidatus Yanofskybacteria bacterium RIFCSPHIGHO2_02_FULL_41_12]OGN20247.1 MAG: hypothetical protein A3B00_02540 [Candidatus Yanofskybacteria bacterium RIFCSPLOWO2_01_FULL_41_33]OGN40532.1 MAG: hypothetical protein A2606_03285 [Can
MNSITTIIIAILSSGVVAAVVSALMQKRNEKEQRIFNAKLEAYREFAAHLESRFVSLTKDGKNLDITTLAEISAKCLLVSNSVLNKELKAFLAYVSEVYKRCSAPDYDEKNEGDIFDKLWKDVDKIEDLMREDLGFK